MDMIRHDDVLQDRHAVKMPGQVQQVLFGDPTEGRQFQGVSYGGRVPAAGARHGGVKTPPYDPGKAAVSAPGTQRQKVDIGRAVIKGGQPGIFPFGVVHGGDLLPASGWITAGYRRTGPRHF